MAWLFAALGAVVAAYLLLLVGGCICFFLLRVFIGFCSRIESRSIVVTLELYLSILALVLAIGAAFAISN
jgi:hypothetical protein